MKQDSWIIFFTEPGTDGESYAIGGNPLWDEAKIREQFMLNSPDATITSVERWTF